MHISICIWLYEIKSPFTTGKKKHIEEVIQIIAISQTSWTSIPKWKSLWQYTLLLLLREFIWIKKYPLQLLSKRDTWETSTLQESNLILLMNNHHDLVLESTTSTTFSHLDLILNINKYHQVCKVWKFCLKHIHKWLELWHLNKYSLYSC